MDGEHLRELWELCSNVRTACDHFDRLLSVVGDGHGDDDEWRELRQLSSEVSHAAIMLLACAHSDGEA